MKQMRCTLCREQETARPDGLCRRCVSSGFYKRLVRGMGPTYEAAVEEAVTKLTRDIKEALGDGCKSQAHVQHHFIEIGPKGHYHDVQIVVDGLEY